MLDHEEHFIMAWTAVFDAREYLRDGDSRRNGSLKFILAPSVLGSYGLPVIYRPLGNNSASASHCDIFGRSARTADRNLS